MDHPHPSQAQDQFTFYRQKPDGDIDPAGEAGWYLQRERERHSMSLDEAGEACGVHPHHLEGIENGDLTRLPPRTEALRMVGMYAQFLGLDPQPLVLHYAQFLPQPMPMARRGKPRRPHPLSSAKIIKFANFDKLKSIGGGAGGIVASVLAAIVAFQGMVFMLSPDTEITPPADGRSGMTAQSQTNGPNGQPGKMSVEEIVASISKVTETPLDDTTDASASLEKGAGETGLSGLTELIEQDFVTSQIPLPKSKPDNAAANTGTRNAPAVSSVDVRAVQTTGSGKIYGGENVNARLVLKARSDVWVRIEDRQGNVVMTQTLRKGDVYRVPNRQGLIVIARDGGLISYAIDGVDKGSLGNQGEILVGRSLDLASLKNQRS